MRALRLIAFVAPLILLGGCASVPDSSGPAGAFVATTATPSSDVSGADAVAREYHLSSGDLLDISVFQVPDLTKEVQVDATGRISLPLIGQMKAAGETAHELETEITTKLRAKYLQTPQVSVFLKSAAGQHVTITGQVMRPGVYPIVGQMSLIQALAQSGDLNQVGDPSSVTVFRQANGQRQVAKFNVEDIRAGKAADPALYAGDMVVVDSSGGRSAWADVKEVFPVAGFATEMAVGAIK